MLSRQFHFILVIWTALIISFVLVLSEYALVTGSP